MKKLLHGTDLCNHPSESPDLRRPYGGDEDFMKQSQSGDQNGGTDSLTEPHTMTMKCRQCGDAWGEKLEWCAE